jgi:hypothetical protein
MGQDDPRDPPSHPGRLAVPRAGPRLGIPGLLIVALVVQAGFGAFALDPRRRRLPAAA